MIKAATIAAYLDQSPCLHPLLLVAFTTYSPTHSRITMTAILSLDYPSSLQEYAVPEQEYLRQHPEYDLLVTGAAIFNKEGKLLLVQRAADEKAFPDLWVSPKCENPWFMGAAIASSCRAY
jgi:hypothetical protein